MPGDARGTDRGRDMIDVMKEAVGTRIGRIFSRSGDALKRQFAKGSRVGPSACRRSEGRASLIRRSVSRDIKGPHDEHGVDQVRHQNQSFDKVRWIRTLVFSTAPVPQVGWVQQYLKEHDPKFVKLIISDGDVQKSDGATSSAGLLGESSACQSHGGRCGTQYRLSARSASAGGGGGDSWRLSLETTDTANASAGLPWSCVLIGVATLWPVWLCRGGMHDGTNVFGE